MVHISFCETNDALSYPSRTRAQPLSDPQCMFVFPAVLSLSCVHVCSNELGGTYSRIDEYNQGDRLILYSCPELLQTHALLQTYALLCPHTRIQC